ncbi:alpha-D-ribose 1-methylphosphonate 5-triphosphate diphosphatase [Ramlibacter sp. H39-3-26]|uniref:alpha-D-ribose 1-methylphosphonate 5-triphosphate diphosphatase n=1 Tax=Curvibacter soli TaxID=3031331 RepID=UPI0023DA7135|nr:alpha-D-ribose 1-methylphosphonate 5-triphosphate diphosphatase [Ramlibacter sp. H39-3-26]MDF1484627.1 alpha-D-ribose 1-methylphosphonate 5-triphosphate diphosphatase [Ramlibacter sp. H39-3-26]
MTQPTVFRNARIVLPDAVVHGSLAVSAGRIADAGAGDRAVPGAIDLEGDYLLPGLVELHTDNLERHLMPRPKVQWPGLPALLAHDAEIAAAGITTVFDALGIGSTDPEELRAHSWAGLLALLDAARAGGVLRADHRIHVRCELPAPNAVELFAPLRGHPLVGLLSLMDHTPGQRQWEKLEKAREYYTGKKGWSQEKFARQVAAGPSFQVRHAEPNRRHFVDYCRAHGIAMASHDDTTAAHVDQASEEGVRIAEFPTTLEAARRARERGLLTVMGAPNMVRGGSHSGNVAAVELARHGLLDILSSDYVPNGLLGAVVRLVDDASIPLPQAVAMASRNPAQAAGLADRGAIEAGRQADLVHVRFLEIPGQRRHPVVRGVWRQGLRII